MISKNIYFLFLAFLMTSLSIKSMADAKMAMQQTIPADDAIVLFEDAEKSRKLTSEETEIYQLARLGRDVLGVKIYRVAGYPDPNVKDQVLHSITRQNIADEMAHAIRRRPSLETPLTKTEIDKIQPYADILKRNWGEASYSWGWLTYQRGQKKEAKDILEKAFDKSYAATMKLKQIGFSRSSHPMADAEALFNGLKPLSSEAENSEREDKLQKMRIHVSNLPDVGIKT